jgi:tetratricopeptide (TPR) repeat protein
MRISPAQALRVLLAQVVALPPLAPLLLGLGAWLVLPPTPAAADPAACAQLLRQAQDLLAEAEVQAQRGYRGKSEGIAQRGLQLVDRAASLCPGEREVPNLGVQLAVFARDPQRGVAYLQIYARSTPYGERDAQLHYLRGLVEVRLLGRPDLGMRSLERMQALTPGLLPTQRDSLYYEALMNYGGALALDGRHEEALKLQRAAESVAKRTGKVARARRARASVGITMSYAERFEEAAAIFLELEQQEPLNPIWPYQRGLMLAHMSRFDAAILAYRASLERQVGWQDEPDILKDLARARMRLGNCLRLKAGSLPRGPEREALEQEALRELKTYAEQQPKEAVGQLWVGIHYYEVDRPLEALPWFERAFALDPDCERTLDYMIQAHMRAGVPVPPGQPLPPEAEMAAWQAKLAAWRKEKEAGSEKRALILKERSRRLGDATGGCL